MRYVLIGLIVLSLSIQFSNTAYADPRNPNEPGEQPAPRYRNDTLIVKLRANAGDDARQDVEALTRGRITWQSRLVPGLTVLRVMPGWVDIYSELLLLLPEVEYVRFDWMGHLHSVTPNDPLYPHQWYLNSIPTQIAINAPCAWSVIKQVDPSCIIAILDGGADSTDTELSPSLWVNPGEIPNNGIDDDNNGYCNDIHGTSTAGIWDNCVLGIEVCSTVQTAPLECDWRHGIHIHHVIASQGNNSTRGTGVAWDATIMHVRIFDNIGFSDSTTISALEYAAEKHAKIINISYSLPVPMPVWPDPLETMIVALEDKVLIVCSAGNEGVNIDFAPPNNFFRRPQLFGTANLIKVAGSLRTINGIQDARVPSSNFSATAVDIAAPGDDLLIPTPSGCNSATCIREGGTSFAAPQVAAVAGFVWTQNPTWSPAQVRQKVLSTARQVASWSGLTTTGGILDAAAAVGAACPTGGEP